MEARRLAGAQLLKTNVAQAEVARRLGVSAQTVSTWAQRLARAGGAAEELKARPKGRRRKLDTEQCQALLGLLAAGALQAGFATDRWTLGRVRTVIEREFRVTYSVPGCWELLLNIGFAQPKPEKSSHR